MPKHYLQEWYQHISPEEIEYIENHDLKDALDEMSRGYDVGKKDEWDYFFELFRDYIVVEDKDQECEWENVGLITFCFRHTKATKEMPSMVAR